VKPHFSDWTRVEMLRLAAESWIGTPFVAHAAIRGAGVDCVNLCAELLQSACFISARRAWPKYVIDGGNHNRDSQIVAWLDANPGFARIWKSGADKAYSAADAMPGDLLCFNLGRSAHHAGMLIAGTKFIHCQWAFARRVVFATLADHTFNRRLAAVYRPMEAS
jgi:cell wall-associated NlpC family hydrolase